MKHLLIILSLLLAGSANCQEQDTTLLADTATTLLSDQQLFELGKKDGIARVGKGATPFFSSAAYVNGWNEGTRMQSVDTEHRKLFRIFAVVALVFLAILGLLYLGVQSLGNISIGI